MAKPTVVFCRSLFYGDGLSAFAVIYNRSNTPVDPNTLDRMMDRLKHRGLDGNDIFMQSHVSMGHWHFWTTPEEANERQPLSLDGMPFVIVFDGRLDNRSDLLVKLKISPMEGANLSDATLILHAYGKWGVNCFERFIGEFALVIFDKQKNELVCARDPLGERTLFYAVYGTCCVIASEPWAVTAATSKPVELNEIAIANYFSFNATQDTFFKDVYEILPANGMIVSGQGQRSWCYWKLDLSLRQSGLSRDDAAAQFRSLLEESVRCRMRSITPTGVMMSGGLDSTSVACLAAKIQSPKQLTTLSFVFNQVKASDERQYIDVVAKRWGIHSIQIPCDDAWPLRDWPARWQPNPNHPETSLYRLLHKRIYDRARQEGLRVLLTGSAGDLLYDGQAECLADLLEDGLWHEMIQELYYLIRYYSLGKTLRSKYTRRVFRRWFDKVPGFKNFHLGSDKIPWLTPFAESIVNKTKMKNFSNRTGSLIDLRIAQMYAHQIFDSRLSALELRHPYRDRRLVEFVGSLPTYHFYRLGFNKHILRIAMDGIIPDEIRTWRGKIHLGPLFSHGMLQEKKTLESTIQEHYEKWSKYVNSNWLNQHWENNHLNWGAEGLVPWLISAFVNWLLFVNSQ